MVYMNYKGEEKIKLLVSLCGVIIFTAQTCAYYYRLSIAVISRVEKKSLLVYMYVSCVKYFSHMFVYVTHVFALWNKKFRRERNKRV